MTGADDATIRVWRLSDGACVRAFPGNPEEALPLPVAVMADLGGGCMASSGRSGIVCVWDVVAGARALCPCPPPMLCRYAA